MFTNLELIVKEKAALGTRDMRLVSIDRRHPALRGSGVKAKILTAILYVCAGADAHCYSARLCTSGLAVFRLSAGQRREILNFRWRL
jgi:hypothetical protein